jgi:hypothetical protein
MEKQGTEEDLGFDLPPPEATHGEETSNSSRLWKNVTAYRGGDVFDLR